MSRVSDLLDAIDARLRAARTIDDKPVFADTRIHLDPYTLDDLMRESVRVPAARLLLANVRTESNAGDSLNLACRLSVVIVAGREGRHDERVASADLAALELSILVAEIIRADPWFGLGRIGAAEIEEFGIVYSERAKGNTRGAAIAGVNFRCRLLDVVHEPAVISRAAETGRLPWTPTGITLNGVDIPADELGVKAGPVPAPTPDPGPDEQEPGTP